MTNIVKKRKIPGTFRGTVPGLIRQFTVALDLLNQDCRVMGRASGYPRTSLREARERFERSRSWAAAGTGGVGIVVMMASMVVPVNWPVWAALTIGGGGLGTAAARAPLGYEPMNAERISALSDPVITDQDVTTRVQMSKVAAQLRDALVNVD